MAIYRWKHHLICFFPQELLGSVEAPKKQVKTASFHFGTKFWLGDGHKWRKGDLLFFFVDSGCDCLYHCHTFLWDVGTLVSWTADSRIYAFCTNHTRCLVLVGWERQEKWKATKNTAWSTGLFWRVHCFKGWVVGKPLVDFVRVDFDEGIKNLDMTSNVTTSTIYSKSISMIIVIIIIIARYAAYRFIDFSFFLVRV